MNRWVQLDRQYLKKRGMVYKISFLVLIVLALIIGYNIYNKKPKLTEIVGMHLNSVDEVKTEFDKLHFEDEKQLNEINTIFHNLYQNYAQENNEYVSNSGAERLIPIYENRIVLIDNLSSYGQDSWIQRLQSLEEIEQKIQLFEYLVKNSISYQHYYYYGNVIQIISQIIGYGGIIFVYLVLTSSYLKRKIQRKTLFEVVPISSIKKLASEVYYTIKWFYALPFMTLVISVIVYSLFIKENLFTYPVNYFFQNKIVYISFLSTLVSVIIYPLLSIVGIYLLLNFLFSLIKDDMVSSILSFVFFYVSIGGHKIGSFLSTLLFPVLEERIPLWLSVIIGVSSSSVMVWIYTRAKWTNNL